MFMNALLRLIGRLNLLVTFLILFGAHGLLYYSLGNASWFWLALSASLVWTAVLAFIKLFARPGMRSK
jgi:hypothetical protein